MKKQKFNSRLLLFLASFIFASNMFSQDPNFHIYLCFGQSNMEGQGTIEAADKIVDSRFKVFQSLDCSNLSRTKATWYTAVPPTCQCYSKLSPADYFGRTMVANLPDSITIGIINVAIGGCDIRIFDKDIYFDYDDTYNESWFTEKVAAYGGNPYKHLIDLAKLAQQDGVIKGILLHQGETNTGHVEWPSYVKKIYNDMMTDLSLNPENIPLIAGHVVDAAYNGCCSSMNTIIDRLPDTLANSYVVSSKGCPDQPDNAHFTAEGYRILGRRYAVQMLTILNKEAVYAEAECGLVGDRLINMKDITAGNGSYVTNIPGEPDQSAAPSTMSNVIQMEFSLASDTTYYFYGRFNNASATSDSYWIKIDDGAYELYDNLITTGWEWIELKTLDLTAGVHTVSVAMKEAGTQIDKLVFKDSQIKPVDVGEEQPEVCVPEISSFQLFAEAECGIIGNKMIVLETTPASNKGYVTNHPGEVSLTSAPTSQSNVIQVNFDLSSNTTYYLFGRFNNSSTSSDSYWIKIDDGQYELIDNLTTSGWEWKELKSMELTAGMHSVYIAMAESGSQIDKIALKMTQEIPVGKGETAESLCKPEIYTGGIDETGAMPGYSLGQNSPNPFSGKTSIPFEIPVSCFVSLKVYNAQGVEVADLLSKNFDAGKHSVDCNLDALPAGKYYYTIKADNFTASKSLIIKKK